MTLPTAFLTNGCTTIRKSSYLGCENGLKLCLRTKHKHAYHRRPYQAITAKLQTNDEENNIRDPSFAENQLLEDSTFIVDVNEDELDPDDESDLIDLSSTNKRKKIRARIGKLVDEILEEPSSTFTNDVDSIPPIEEDETTELARTAVRAADQRKAEDILALRISKLSYVASFLIIATGNNAPQIRAIANIIEGDIKKEHGLLPKHIEGVANSGWILLDYGDMLVNVFSPAQRENYNLENLWKRAEELDISDCLMQRPDEPDAIDSSDSLDDWLSG